MFYVQTTRTVPVDDRHPVGIAVDTHELPSLQAAVDATGTTGAIFSDELTYGRTMIRNTNGEWVNDYANPSHPLNQV